MSEHSHDPGDRQPPEQTVSAEEIRAFTEGYKRAARAAKLGREPRPRAVTELQQRRPEPSPATSGDAARRLEQLVTQSATANRSTLTTSAAAASDAASAALRARAETPPPNATPRKPSPLERSDAFAAGKSHGERIEAARARRKDVAAERRARARKANERLAARVHAEFGPILEARGAGLTVDQMTMIPREVWHTSWAIRSDPSGRAVWAAFRDCSTARRAHMLTLALGVDDEGVARYRFSDARARCVAAVFYVLVAMEKQTRRSGPWGGGVVLGLTRNAFCALLRDVNDPRGGIPCLTTVFGTHVPANGRTDRERLQRPWELGYMTVLKLGKAVYSQQLPSADAEPCERWGAYTSARYWVGAWEFETIYRRTGAAVGGLMELATVWVREGLEAALRGLRAPPADEPLAAPA